MALTVTHAPVAGVNNPAYPVSDTVWEAAHVITGSDSGPIVNLADGSANSHDAASLTAGAALLSAIAGLSTASDNPGGVIQLGHGFYDLADSGTGSQLSLAGLDLVHIRGVGGITGGAAGGSVIESYNTGSGVLVNLADITNCTFSDLMIRYESTSFTGTLLSTAASTFQASSLRLNDVILWGRHDAGETAVLLNLSRSIIGQFNRVFFNGGGIGVIGVRSVAVTGMSVGNPTIVTAPGHGFTTGEKINLGGVVTTPPTSVSPPNVEPATCTVIDANSFSLPYNVTVVTDGVGFATSNGDFSNVQSFRDCKWIQQGIMPVRNPGESYVFENPTVQALQSGDVGFIDHNAGNRQRGLTIVGGGNYDQTTNNPGSIIKWAGSGLSVTGFNASGRSSSVITFLTIDDNACQGVFVAGNNFNAVKYGIDFGTTTAHLRGQFGPNSWDNDYTGYLPVTGTLPLGLAIVPSDQATKPDVFWWAGGNNGDTGQTRLQFDNDALAYFERSAAGILVTPAILRPAAFGVTAVISPTQLVANTDNWGPTGLATAFLIRANVNAALNITGIVAQPAGTILRLFNTTAFTITLVHEATSTAANRFLCPGATNFALRQKGSVDLTYSSADSRWLVLGA